MIFRSYRALTAVLSPNAPGSRCGSNTFLVRLATADGFERPIAILRGRLNRLRESERSEAFCRAILVGVEVIWYI